MHSEILIRFLLAAVCGGIIGAEREYRSKSAGFRTMIMIAIGACLFTMMSEQIGGVGNPDRIASNIVTGIGFLGAGVIFRGENRVNGITTAASIWGGLCTGYGYWRRLLFCFSLCLCSYHDRAGCVALPRNVDRQNQPVERLYYTMQLCYRHQAAFRGDIQAIWP